MKVDVSFGDLSIIVYPRNYTQYNDWEIREARLKIVNDKAFLNLSEGDSAANYVWWRC